MGEPLSLVPKESRFPHPPSRKKGIVFGDVLPTAYCLLPVVCCLEKLHKPLQMLGFMPAKPLDMPSRKNAGTHTTAYCLLPIAYCYG